MQGKRKIVPFTSYVTLFLFHRQEDLPLSNVWWIRVTTEKCLLNFLGKIMRGIFQKTL